MASITITVPDAVAADVGNAFDAQFPGRPPGTTKAQWAEQKLREYARGIYRGYKANEARQTAGDTALTAADAAFPPT